MISTRMGLCIIISLYYFHTPRGMWYSRVLLLLLLFRIAF